MYKQQNLNLNLKTYTTSAESGQIQAYFMNVWWPLSLVIQEKEEKKEQSGENSLMKYICQTMSRICLKHPVTKILDNCVRQPHLLLLPPIVQTGISTKYIYILQIFLALLKIIHISDFARISQCRQTWNGLKVLCQKFLCNFYTTNYLRNLVLPSATSNLTKGSFRDH